MTDDYGYDYECQNCPYGTNIGERGEAHEEITGHWVKDVTA